MVGELVSIPHLDRSFHRNIKAALIGIEAAEGNGDIQAVREMKVFLKRVDKALNGHDMCTRQACLFVEAGPGVPEAQIRRAPRVGLGG